MSSITCRVNRASRVAANYFSSLAYLITLKATVSRSVPKIAGWIPRTRCPSPLFLCKRKTETRRLCVKMAYLLSRAGHVFAGARARAEHLEAPRAQPPPLNRGYLETCVYTHGVCTAQSWITRRATSFPTSRAHAGDGGGRETQRNVPSFHAHIAPREPARVINTYAGYTHARAHAALTSLASDEMNYRRQLLSSEIYDRRGQARGEARDSRQLFLMRASKRRPKERRTRSRSVERDARREREKGPSPRNYYARAGFRTFGTFDGKRETRALYAVVIGASHALVARLARASFPCTVSSLSRL